jgi:hypothetical protein
MPKVEKGSKIIAIERIIRSTGLLEALMAIASSDGCKCFIVDSPFIATTNVKGFTVEQVVGVGSLVCTADCPVEADAVAVAPTWGYGRYIGGKCIVAGTIPGLPILRSVGYEVEEVDFDEVFDAAAKQYVKGVVYLPAFRERLEVAEEEGSCGRLLSLNPLHPAGAIGKPRQAVCVDKIYRLVGPLARLTHTILSVEDKPLIQTYGGLGELAIVGFDLDSSEAILSTAAWLSILYTCGTGEAV